MLSGPVRATDDRPAVTTSGVPLARNETGLPARPAAVAVSALAPAVVPNVQDVSVAMPAASVLTMVPLIGAVVPPPLVIANVTGWFATGLLLASRTWTAGTEATVAPTVALWL